MNFALPDKRSVPVFIENGWVGIYGEPCTGKSQLASTFPRPLFIHLEPRLDHISCFKIPEKPLASAAEINSFIIWISTRYEMIRKNFDYIVIDSWSRLYEICFDGVMARETRKNSNYQHPSDIGEFGKGWGLINNAAQKTILSISQIGLPLVVIMHEEEKEGKIKPMLTDTNFTYLNSRISTIIRLTNYQGQVHARIKPSQTMIAKLSIPVEWDRDKIPDTIADPDWNRIVAAIHEANPNKENIEEEASEPNELDKQLDSVIEAVEKEVNDALGDVFDSPSKGNINPVAVAPTTPITTPDTTTIETGVVDTKAYSTDDVVDDLVGSYPKNLELGVITGTKDDAKALAEEVASDYKASDMIQKGNMLGSLMIEQGRIGGLIKSKPGGADKIGSMKKDALDKAGVSFITQIKTWENAVTFLTHYNSLYESLGE